jgi:hypothetical protein
MSGESIYGLYAKSVSAEKQPVKTASPYSGKYEKRMDEPTKPVYSTFYEKGKEYDGSNVRFFKQREAVIGKNVGDSVDPQNYLKKGGGIRHVVPPVHEEKVYCKPPLDEIFRQAGNSKGASVNEKSRSAGEFGENVVSNSQDGGSRSDGANGEGTAYDENGNRLRGEQGYGNSNTSGDLRASRDATKDFVASNIVEAGNMVPKRRKQQEPLATSRKSFGQAPAYLSRVKGEVAQEKAVVQSLEETKKQRQKQVYSKYVYLLPREEHEKLVGDLETRRDECVAELQKIPFSKDTPSMRKRKTELERTVADVETALKKLDKDALFIYKDDPVNGQWAKEAALKEAQKFAAESL